MSMPRLAGADMAGADDAAKVADLSQLQRERAYAEESQHVTVPHMRAYAEESQHLRRAYAEESQQMLRKQQGVIDKLRRENDALKSSLALEFRQFKKPSEGGVAERVLKLQDQVDWYTSHIEAERTSLIEMGERIRGARDALLRQRRAMGGVNAAKENEQMIQKQVRILENRLDKALTKFNEALGQNKALRREIDDLRREREVFDAIYRRLERDLAERKRAMAAIIEQSNAAYEQRDNNQLEIAAIEQANRQEQSDFAAKMMELGRVIEGTLKLPPHAASRRATTGAAPAAAAAGAHGLSAAAAAASPPAGAHGGLLTAQGGEESCGLGTVPRMGDGPNQGSRNASTEREDAQASLERIQNFEEAFNRIRAATGVSDVDALVRTFIKNENQNFSLFSYVNEQQNDIEKLEEQIQALKAEEARHEQASGDGAHLHRSAAKTLQARTQAAEAAAERLEARCGDAVAALDALRAGARSLVAAALPGGFAALPDALADGAVTESALLPVLAAVEERANAMLRAYAAARAAEERAAAGGGGGSGEAGDAGGEEGGAESPPKLATSRMDGFGSASHGAFGEAPEEQANISVLGRGPKTPMGQELLRVTPPRLEDYSSDDDDDDGGGGGSGDGERRPLSHEEVHARAVANLHRRAARAAAAAKRGARKS
ncbi:outer dynein arm docking complex protein like [Tribonema minus]|uniref:Outer dynein arm docking complex protein like n=1 Tax=Tribonema minus TaxID=303371 RepID=A0A836C807_9STRA|nr:outer dynein arm docking complex protein like [Tribonema minus]